jgi:hypothetical protein
MASQESRSYPLKYLTSTRSRSRTCRTLLFAHSVKPWCNSSYSRWSLFPYWSILRYSSRHLCAHIGYRSRMRRSPLRGSYGLGRDARCSPSFLRILFTASRQIRTSRLCHPCKFHLLVVIWLYTWGSEPRARTAICKNKDKMGRCIASCHGTLLGTDCSTSSQWPRPLSRWTQLTWPSLKHRTLPPSGVPYHDVHRSTWIWTSMPPLLPYACSRQACSSLGWQSPHRS